MAAVAFSLIGAYLGGALVWLVIGARLRLGRSAVANDWYNIAAYAALLLPFMLLIVFVGVAPI
ncbi:MAG: hypothetical protein AAGG11_18255 [Pseudomonadota bacterium]